LLLLTLLAGVCLIVFSGCKAEEPPPPPPPAPPPPPPPPPTPEEIEAEIRATFEPKYKILYSLVSGDAAAAQQQQQQQQPQLRRNRRSEDDEEELEPLQQMATEQQVKDSIKTDLLNAKNKHSGTDYGQKGLKRVANMFERDITKGYEQGPNNRKMYNVVFMACDLLEVLEPESTMLSRYRQLAKDQLNRPEVKITGSTTMDGETTWFFQVTLPETGTMESVRARKGDEFYGLRFVNVLGNNRAVELEYLKLNERFIVPGP